MTYSHVHLENVLLCNFEDNSLSLYLTFYKNYHRTPYTERHLFLFCLNRGPAIFWLIAQYCTEKCFYSSFHKCLYLCHLCGQVSSYSTVYTFKGSLANLGLLLGFEGWKMIMTTKLIQKVLYSGKDKCRESNCFSANFCPKG